MLTLKHQKLDWKDQHQNTKQSNHHHLYDVQRAMNLPETFTFGDTLDTIFVTLLENLKVIHDCNIVHRDCEFKTNIHHIAIFGHWIIFSSITSPQLLYLSV